MRRISLVLAVVFVLSVMVATAAPAMADDHWRGDKKWSWGHHKKPHHKKHHWNWWWGCDWEWTPWGWKWDCPWWD